MLRLEALLGSAICGDDPAIRERSQRFFARTDEGRVGTSPTALAGVEDA